MSDINNIKHKTGSNSYTESISLKGGLDAYGPLLRLLLDVYTYKIDK